MLKEEFIIVGKVVSAYGVRGWVKVFSETDPVTNILDYLPWYLCLNGRWTEVEMLDGRLQGTAVVAQLQGVNDRDAALALAHSEIAVKRDQLPALPPGEYYWADLMGLAVVNQQDVELGVIKDVFATGANDVLVVQGDVERLIPFVNGIVVLDVDLAQRRMRVDWDADYE